jgi:thiol:disulfide interchange protein DsbD
MIDPTTAAMTAIMHGDAARFPLVACAGMLTSIGPCVAPRYVALASILSGPRRAITIALFIAGIITVYMALGFGAGLLSAVTQNAARIDVALALILVAGGLVTLLRRSEHRCHDGAASVTPHRLSSIFCLGAASALVISPCCTPIVAAVIAFPSLDPSPGARAALLGAFAFGHAVPLLALGSTGALFAERLHRWTASPAPAVVSGTLMLALGAYYGLLA